MHRNWMFFLLNRKRVILFPFTKKETNNKQKLKNYRPVSLLPICGKILENLLFKEMFKFFIKHKLISSNQSGFKPWRFLHYSSVIYHSWDIWIFWCGAFLDTFKAFDVWQNGIILKLTQNRILVNLLNFLQDF